MSAELERAVDGAAVTDFAANPSARILAAESRRELRALLEDSSLGTSGARAMRKRGGGHDLTADEEAAAVAELDELERTLALRRRT